MSRVLIIEDDFELAKSVAGWLRGEQYLVDHCSAGSDGLKTALQGNFDIIILDIGLPDLDGFSICKTLREQGSNAVILMLTGRDHVNDRITGLDTGADDYLTKPFSARELSARLRAILRRPAAVKESVLSLNTDDCEIVLDLRNHRVTKNGVHITLLPTDYRLLKFLMQNPSRTFSAEELLAAIWEDKFPTDNAVRSSVRRIRRALGDDIIETASKLGYRLRQP